MKFTINVPVEVTIDDDAPNLARVTADLAWTFRGMTNKTTSGFWRVEQKGDTITAEELAHVITSNVLVKAMTDTGICEIHNIDDCGCDQLKKQLTSGL